MASHQRLYAIPIPEGQDNLGMFFNVVTGFMLSVPATGSGDYSVVYASTFLFTGPAAACLIELDRWRERIEEAR